MFGRRLTLFKLFGFSVRVDASWLIIALLVTWSLASSVFPYFYPGLTGGQLWWMGALGALGLFGSIVLHELSHSLVARRYGLPIKGITLFVFGGVAEMEEEPPSPKAELMMAIAGPIASILIGVLAYMIARAGRYTLPVEAAGVLSYLSWINLILAGFNLMPAFPLDGGRVLRSALWYWRGSLARATRTAAFFGEAFAIVLMALSVFQLFSGNLIGAVWWFLLGLFLRNASRFSYRQLLVKAALEGEPLRHFMKTDPVVVPPNVSIRELVDDYIYRYHYKMFPVVTGSQALVGCVTTEQVKGISRDEWATHQVWEVTKSCGVDNTVSPDTDAIRALAIMSKSGATRLMVVERGRLVGVVALKDLLKFLSLKLDLEGYSQDGLLSESSLLMSAHRGN